MTFKKFIAIWIVVLIGAFLWITTPTHNYTAGANSGQLLLLILFASYFFPTIVAHFRKHSNATAIFVLNLFLGWTFVGWVIALVWAFTHETASVAQRFGNDRPAHLTRERP
jgi:hypothetical protein